MAKVTAVAFCLLLLLATTAPAQNDRPDKKDGFAYRHQAGARLGVWANLGDLPARSGGNSVSQWEADIKPASFYAEAYFGYRFLPALMGEISIGIVNRGDVTVVETANGISDSYIGNITVYPIQARLKIYPLASTTGRLYPYIMGGVGLYHARHDIQFTTDYYFGTGPSRTSFSYTVGAGIDIPVASQIALDGAVTYMPINFSKDLLFTRNYDALTITVGAKYLFSSMSK